MDVVFAPVGRTVASMAGGNDVIVQDTIEHQSALSITLLVDAINIINTGRCSLNVLAIFRGYIWNVYMFIYMCKRIYIYIID